MANEKSGIRSYVARIALEYNDGENVQSFFHDLLSHGCISGMISELIYYNDTHAFYDKYYDEIEELRLELEASCGSLSIKSDYKNFMAWFAFEETARRIADELGLPD